MEAGSRPVRLKAMSRALIMCESGGEPVLTAPDAAACSDGASYYAVTLQAAPLDLSALSWSETSLLMSAALSAVALAAAFNLVSSFIWGRK